MGRDPLSFSSQKKFVPHLQAEKMDHPSFSNAGLGRLGFHDRPSHDGGDSLFSFSSGSPEVLVLVLDRSASMETRTEKDPQTKRAKALDAFQVFAERWTESRLVVIDTALEDPFFIDKAASVKDAALERFFGPTDTSADLPGTLSKALDWLEKSGVGTAEILLASDMQISNWNLDRNSEVMEKINRILVQKKDLWKLNLLNLDDAPPYNLSMTLDRVNRMPGRVEPVVNLNKSGQGNERLRLSVNTNGSPGNIDLELTSPSMLWRPTFDLENEPEEGWISILGPDDFCQPDNACYLAYGVTTPPKWRFAPTIRERTWFSDQPLNPSWERLPTPCRSRHWRKSNCSCAKY